ncbi:MAG TPA: hypothetical protein VFN74_15140 [Chloroflexota bacterium]|nr:hypothetical protein [Chloroflexota bacterium]
MTTAAPRSTAALPELPDAATLRLDFLEYWTHALPHTAVGREALESPRQGLFLQIPKLELAHRIGDPTALPPLDEGAVRRALASVNERVDCSDFTMAALLRILYRYPTSPLLTPELKQEIERTVLDFKYWIHEPGQDVMCFWTENHQILFATAELLAGQLFPDTTFTNNGKTGRWHMHHATKAIHHWIAWRLQYGFSEWLSNCYYDEDLLALVNLCDFAQDGDLRHGARRTIDLILFDIAVHSYRGTFGATHGRAYMRDIRPATSPVSAVSQLFWGLGGLGRVSLSAPLLATSDYAAPDAIRAIAVDRPAEMIARARHSLNVEDAFLRGLNPGNAQQLMFFWGAQVRHHARVVEHSLAYTPPEHYLVPRITAWRDHFAFQQRAGQPFDPDLDASANTQVDIYTYRTPDYQLSCAQDYRPGKVGFQQHIWQATLGGDTPEEKVVVYASHPGSEELRGRPSYWTGNAVLPRALAYKSLVLSFHWVSPQQSSLWYTHAYFPWTRFDETAESGDWLFGRKGDGYVALRSLRPSFWADPTAKSIFNPLTSGERTLLGSMTGRQVDLGESGPPPPYDRVAPGHRNVWLCELGRRATHGSFPDFVRAIGRVRLEGDEWRLTYESPTLGRVEAGWSLPLTVKGEEVSLHDYPRFENPYAHAPFADTRFELRCGPLTHTIT